jgi:N-acetylglucosamine-6-phosphate deacetylase
MRIHVAGPIHGHPGADGLLVEDGRIGWIGAGRPPARAGERLEVPAGGLAVPGFIDLQVNGFAARDASGGGEALCVISSRLPETGVTGFLPTLISSPLDECLDFVGAAREAAAPGARILGVHLEGPFLNPAFRGAHDRRRLLEPGEAAVSRLLEAPPRMLTLAPELPGALAAIHRLQRAGVVVGAGHSGADYETGRRAIAAGVRFGTHIFNAMTGFHHRRPGLPAALLGDPRVTVGLIADGHHLHPATCEQTIRAKGYRKVALTTDQTAAAWAEPGAYPLAGRSTSSDGATVRLPNGRLAGSLATMDELVRRSAALAGVGVERAVAMASAVPARLLGERRLGRLEVGAAADVVLLDAELRVCLTMVGGRAVYRR